MVRKRYADLFKPRTEEEVANAQQGWQPYRGADEVQAHAASLLPPLATAGVRVEVHLAEFTATSMGFSARELSRVFPRDAVVGDVYNLVVAEGLEPGIFELDVRKDDDQEDLRGRKPKVEWLRHPEPPRGRRVTNCSSERLDSFGETVRFYAAHSAFYLERRLYH